MAFINAEMFTRAGQSEIRTADITNRIDGLRDDLTTFYDQVERVTGNHFDEATIVPEDSFVQHAQDWARSLADFDFLDSYVNWHRFAYDLRSERYTEVEFGDDTVYVK